MLFTVARVVATVPIEVVMSPVSAGSLPGGSVPLDIFEAFRALVVADGANATPFVADTTTAPVLGVIEASPVAVKPPNAPELLYWI